MIQNSDSLQSLANISYVNRDYGALKNAMNQYLLNYFPNAGSDFSEGAGTQVLIEIITFCTDILNFYLDKQFNELFLLRSVETKNIYDLAHGLGYNPKSLSPSIASINVTFDVPVTGSSTSQFYFNISKGSQFTASTVGTLFENMETFVFNNETSNLFQSQILTRTDGITVTRFTLPNVQIISGTTKIIAQAIDQSLVTFKNIHIPDTNINTVLRVRDSQGFEWYQVQNLAQEFIFTGIPNYNTDSSSSVPYLMTVKRVPRRFVATYNQDGSADITFGSGEINLTDTEFVLNPENFVFPNQTIGKFLNFSPDAIQLNDFLNTTSLGVTPQNVTIYIEYRVGGGISDNIGANLIDSVQNVDIQFYSINLPSAVIKFVYDSIVVNNPEPSQGGANAETIDQIRTNASYWYSAQDRVVSIEDYVARVASIPSQYGSVYKVVAQQVKNQSYQNLNTITQLIDQLVSQRSSGIDDSVLKNQIINLNSNIKNNSADVRLFVISQDSSGNLQKTANVVKQNILTYLNYFKVASDTVDIEDVNIINLGIRFSLNVDVLRYNPSEVLLNAINIVENFTLLANMEVGQNINIDSLRVILKNLTGVISVTELTFFTISGNVDGRQYSNDFTSTIDSLLTFSETIIQCPVDSIFEIRYPQFDILGRFVN